MNTELYEIYEAVAEISDGLMENRIEFTYDRLDGIMGCHPSEALEMILTKIDWDSRSPDIDKVSEALDELVEFNKCYNVKELNAPIKKLKKFLSSNKQ
jgi:hypothetical protein